MKGLLMLVFSSILFSSFCLADMVVPGSGQILLEEGFPLYLYLLIPLIALVIIVWILINRRKNAK